MDEEADKLEIIYERKPYEQLPLLMSVHRPSERYTAAAREHYWARKMAVITDGTDSPLVKTPAQVFLSSESVSLIPVPTWRSASGCFCLP